MSIPKGEIQRCEYRRARTRWRLRTTLVQHRACLFLAGYDQRFLVDFGIDNAVEKAKSLRWTMKQKRTQP